MRGIKHAVMLGAVSILLSGGTAHAKDLSGRIGVGALQTIGGVSGISARFQATPKIGVQTIVNIGVASPDEGDFGYGVGLGLRGLYSIIDAGDFNGSVGLGVDFTYQDSGGSLMQFGFHVPVRMEYFFTNWFALNLEMGLRFNIVGDDGVLLNAPGNGLLAGKGFGVDLNHTLFGGGGFSFYF